MKETEKYYLFWKHQFGQWTLREMKDPEGITYNCCEQYMMYKKAQLFDDKEIANRILEEQDPSNQQKLGRTIKNFNEEVWNKNKLGIVWYANYLKFSQHEDLKIRLLATKDRILAEASPYDLIWGIGYKATDEMALDDKNWKGQNLLGHTLMSIRTIMKLSQSEKI